ncbi:hypothetical protein ACROYT_G006654 [Oculina patagonica]
MSAIEYNNLLFEISQRLDELNVRDRLLFMCRGKLASGSEDNIQDALSLFNALEEQNYLGIDRVEEMKELLKGFREWSLFGKVRKFESKRKEYNDLLEQIIGALDELNDVERLVAMCRGKISEESEDHIQDVRSLLKELENQNNLGTHRLVVLKKILTEMEKDDLVKEVEEFEERRNQEDESERKKEQRGALVSSAENKFIGVVKLVCNFCTQAGSLLVVTSAMALRGCSSAKEYMEVFKDVVLVSYNKLVGIREGSLCFIVQAETPSALRELWDIYKSGALQTRLQDFLVTKEIKQLANGEDVGVTVYIDEQEYKEACLELMLVENQASDVKEEKKLVVRLRRNSDSFLCFKPYEDDVTLMKLKQAEKKWNFERQRREALEEENEKLTTEIVEAENVQRRMSWREEESAKTTFTVAQLTVEAKTNVNKGGHTLSFTAQDTEDIERPRKRRRRNSDSILYCKERDEEVGESNKEQKIALEKKTKYLDANIEAFVQRYLQSIPETHSVTTETSDSGIGTSVAPSDFDEMEHISDQPKTYCLKDLSRIVIDQMNTRLEGDDIALRYINQSFGISGHLQSLKSIFELFPDTPVKLMKDVLEALQLYDLVDLLPEKPQQARSLRLALPLKEIDRLRKAADGRPTTYHSSAAVLIIADKQTSKTEGFRNFFKGLNSKSDVTIIECRNASKMEREVMRMEDWWKSKGRQRPTEAEIQKKKEELQMEMENTKMAALAVIDRWIHNQGW